MATINLGKVITDAQKAVLDKQSYDSVNAKLVITGDENVTGSLTADEIVENMEGYFFTKDSTMANDFSYTYVGAVKNGNKLTITIFGKLTASKSDYVGQLFGGFNVPQAVADKLYPFNITGATDVLSQFRASLYSSWDTFISADCLIQKYDKVVTCKLYATNLVIGTEYAIRIEQTFLLSDNLAE